MERAETAARLLDVGSRIALLPNTEQGYRNEWDSLLRASGTAGQFAATYGNASEDNLRQFLFFDRDNPSSVFSCIEKARESGRIVRTALTAQVWDALNMGYQEMRRLPTSTEVSDLSDFTARVGATVRGAIEGTQLRNDGWHFMNIGSGLERADSTARLLDVKYFVLLPRVEFVGSELDSYQWKVILRAMSLLRGFSWAYGGEISANLVADFLIMNRESPRSLITSLTQTLWHLEGLAQLYGDDLPASARDTARSLTTALSARDVDMIFEEGLHEFLSWFIGEISVVANGVQQDYFSGRG